MRARRRRARALRVAGDACRAGEGPHTSAPPRSTPTAPSTPRRPARLDGARPAARHPARARRGARGQRRHGHARLRPAAATSRLRVQRRRRRRSSRCTRAVHGRRAWLPGPHTIDVRAVDADGRADPTPQRWTFEVPAQRSALGAGGSGTDLDRDRIPDTDEMLPLGNVPPVAGVRTLATLVSGTVYVKLPVRRSRLHRPGRSRASSRSRGWRRCRSGRSSTRAAGRSALQTAGDGRPAGDRRRRLGRATLSAAIFRIRQASVRRAALRPRAIPTSLVLPAPRDGALPVRRARQGRRAHAHARPPRACSA